MDGMTYELFSTPKEEALAVLYVQAQDLKGMTPTEVADLYQSAYNEICQRLASENDVKRTWL